MALGGALGSFHVAGVAQTHIYRRFAWQACYRWHWVARLVLVRRPWRRGILRGRRGTWWHPPSFHVAGVAQTHIYRRFAWQACYRWHWVARLVLVRRPWRRGILRGSRGTWWHPPSFHVAGVAGVAFSVVLRGRRATDGIGWRAWSWLGARDAAAFCIAGVAQTHIYRRFAWQAWHKLTSTVVLCGRRATDGTGWRAWSWLGARDAAAFCVAGVALGDIHRHFTWQAWHKLTSTVVLRGRRATDGTGWRAWSWLGARDAAAFCVAAVALGDIHRHFTWQACYRWHWVARLVLVRRPWRRGILRGSRGTWWHPPSFHVAGVAQTHIYRRFAWQACYRWHWVARLVLVRRPWRRATLCGRRGTTWHPPSFHVAGVAQTHIYRRFAWQAWHLWYWVAPLGRDLAPVTPGAPRHFAWQAWWHLVTSTFLSRGRRGTNSHLPSFCVAGVALMVLGGALGPGFGACDARGAAPLCVAGVALGDIHLDYMQGRFAWQAPHSWHLVTYTLISRGRRRGTISHPWSHQLILTICQVWLPATGPAERVRKICGFARKSAEHYFGQRKYGEHTIALIAEPGGTRRKRSNLLTDNLLTNNLPYIPTYMTYIPTYLPTYIHSYLPFYLLDLSAPPLSFLSSQSPLKPLKLIFGRSWLVGLSGPLIKFFPYWLICIHI